MMSNIGAKEKTKAEIAAELAATRERLAQLEAAEAERRRGAQVQDALYGSGLLQTGPLRPKPTQLLSAPDDQVDRHVLGRREPGFRLL